MVRITAQQITDERGEYSLLDDVFPSDMRARGFESVRTSVFERPIKERGKQTLAQLRANDQFSLLATHLIERGHPEHELVVYGLHHNIKMIRVGSKEFRAHRYKVYEKTDGE